MKREEQILKRLTEQEGGLFYDTALRAMREFAKKDLLPPAEGAKKVQWSGYGELGNISQKPLQPTAEGAEEILASLVESLGEPDNSVTDHSYEIRPLTVEGKREWWMFHNGVGSGEPLTQWLNEFATLHAQKIADKMAEERLKNAPKNCPKAAQCAHVEGGMKCPPIDGSFKQHTKATKKRRAVKGTSDALDYDDVMRIGNDLLWHSRQPQKGFYLILAVNTGLRVGDLMTLKHSDLIGKRTGDKLIIVEQKTGKRREIDINEKTVTAYSYLLKRIRVKPSNFIFLSQKNQVFATVSINRFLKDTFKGYAPVVSSHSLRKAFGKRVYEMAGKNDHALIKLSQIFGHSKTEVTRRYLGISKEEIANIYLNL